jgi:mannose-6-phosphate isomerase
MPFVRLVRAETLRPLRQRVLRPALRPEEVVLDGDDAPESLHVAAYADAASDEVLAVASACLESPIDDGRGRVGMMRESDPPLHWRVRAVASAPEVRGQGYGAAVMRALTALVCAASGGRPFLLWFDARLPAVPFYQHLGFSTRGAEHVRPSGPHYVMVRTFTPDEARAWVHAYHAEHAAAFALPPLYPLRLRPALHAKVWGGRRLAERWGKALPTDEAYGESWEMHDTAVIADGPLAGRSVGSLLALYGRDVLGRAGNPADGMPLLAKILDAEAWLSVQVHPNDAQAAALEGEPRGKTEAWAVLDAEPGARLIVAVQPGTTREQLADAVRAGTLESLLVYAEVEPGDVILNHAGGIHALGPGIVIYEIQQSSDVTYRLYDWNRTGRALHIEKALAVADPDRMPHIVKTAHLAGPTVELCACDYFSLHAHMLSPGETRALAVEDGFRILTCIEGAVTVTGEHGRAVLGCGETALVPAALGRVALVSETGGRVLDSTAPAGAAR